MLEFTTAALLLQGMQLEVNALDGRSAQFIVRPNTLLRKVFYHFRLRLGIDSSDGKFLLNGDILSGYETPASEKMQPGDCITWMPTQLGD